MQPIDKGYTTKTYEEGDRVEAQLGKSLNAQTLAVVEFEYQGSVTNNTHIKAHSDVDLLALHAHFHTIQPPGKPTFVYQLYKETQELVDDINKGLSRSFRKLAEARVSY